jgi:hypothetical protein
MASRVSFGSIRTVLGFVAFVLVFGILVELDESSGYLNRVVELGCRSQLGIFNRTFGSAATDPDVGRSPVEDHFDRRNPSVGTRKSGS